MPLFPAIFTAVTLATLLVAAATRAQTTTATSTGPTSTTIMPCAEPAAVDVWVRNESGLSEIAVEVDGSLDGAAATCTGAPGLAETYAATVTCRGTGLVRCTAAGAPARIAALRPGAWVHRMRVAPGPAGSDGQRLARRAVVTAGSRTANAVVWTVFGFARTVATPAAADLRAALDAAAAWTAANPGRRALVSLRPPGPVVLDPANCAPDPTCSASLVAPRAGLCLAGDRIVLDGRDDDGRRAAELTVGARTMPVIRVYGRDVELRGLRLVGMRNGGANQADTLAFMSSSRRSALVDSTVTGPSRGDGIGSCGGGSDADANLVVDSEIRQAQDKGVKVTAGGVQVVSGSCIADNANGGIQATLGGRLLARENVVQHNVPGGSDHGISANHGDAAASSVVTRGNIVRFSGTRGLSVIDNAVGEFHDDYVARNQYAGALVETTRPGFRPRAWFRGSAFVCNNVAFVSANCARTDGQPDGRPCLDVGDCGPEADFRCTTTFPAGVGLGIQFPQQPGRACACETPPCPCDAPVVTLGDGAAGNTPIASTRNARTLAGANLLLNVPGGALAAGGTQWEGCDTPACGNAAEDVVRATNIRAASGARVDLLPIVPSGGSPLALTGVSPARPRAGDIVRVYGRGFDAVNGNALSPSCGHPPPRDADFCDPFDASLAQINRTANGNRMRLSIGGQTWPLDVVAVTPGMLAFRMPVDCFAPATITVLRGAATRLLDMCDPAGCAGQPAGVACADDGNPCTDGRCDGAGACVHRPRPAGTVCRAATGPCDATEVCDGTASPCPPDLKQPASHVCRAAAGPCDRPEQCDGSSNDCPADAKEPATAVCRPVAGPCDVAERCDGASDVCPPDEFVPAGSECRRSTDECDPAETCGGASPVCPDDVRRTGLDGVGCRLERLTALAAGACGDATRVQRLLRRTGIVFQRARRACDAGRPGKARRGLRRMSRLLGRLETRFRADACLRGLGAPQTARRVRELMREQRAPCDR